MKTFLKNHYSKILIIIWITFVIFQAYNTRYEGTFLNILFGLFFAFIIGYYFSKKK
jgi:uncharacterized membrane protein